MGWMAIGPRQMKLAPTVMLANVINVLYLNVQVWSWPCSSDRGANPLRRSIT